MFGKLLLLFIIVPFVELVLLLKIGAKIGFGPTVAIIIVTAILGASLTRAQGARALRRFHEATAAGRLPHAEVLDGLMILIAGAVLLTPGFLTDIAGFLLLVPPVRAVVRKQLGQALKGRVHVVGPGSHAGASTSPSPRGNERIIEAKVIDMEPDESTK